MPDTVRLRFKQRVIYLQRGPTLRSARLITNQAWIVRNVDAITESIVSHMRSQNPPGQEGGPTWFGTNISPYPDEARTDWVLQNILSGRLKLFVDVMDPFEGQIPGNNGQAIRFALSRSRVLPNYTLNNDNNFFTNYSAAIIDYFLAKYSNVSDLFEEDVQGMPGFRRHELILRLIKAGDLFIHIAN